MIIQMVTQMSGGRYDDQSWPTPWTDFEVPDDEGRGLIRCGAAMEVVGGLVKPAPDDDPEPVPEADPEPAPAVTPEPAGGPPAVGDPKADWVEHAVNQGATREEAESQTKAQLQQNYGGRL